MLYHDDVKTYEQFREVKGNKVRLEIERGAVHDIILIGHVVGFEREAELGAKRAGEFLESCTL